MINRYRALAKTCLSVFRHSVFNHSRCRYTVCDRNRCGIDRSHTRRSHVWRYRNICLLLLALVSNTIHAKEETALQVDYPKRDFGYFIGDVLVQRINVDSVALQMTEPSIDLALEIETSWPSGVRVDDYLYRLSSGLLQKKGQRWLELRYQIINSPANTATINLPPITMTTRAGMPVSTQTWPFNVSRLTSNATGLAVDVSATGETNSRQNSMILQADRTAMDTLRKRSSVTLKASVAALAVWLLLWLCWWLWRERRDAITLPFARAHKIIRKLPGSQSDADAWIALHRAFNSVAGKTISTGSVADLLNAAPWLLPSKESINDFYAASAARFFQQANDNPSFDVASLCTTLYKAEKQQTRSATGMAR